MNESLKPDSTSPPADSAGGSWEQLPPGTLANLQSRLQRRESRRQFVRLASAAGILVATGGAGYLWLTKTPSTGDGELRYAGLTCREAMDAAPDVVAGKAPAALADKVRSHIAQCAGCQSHFPNYPKLG